MIPYTPYKTFDPALYAAHDLPAKLAFSGAFTERYGWTINQSGLRDCDFSCRRADGSMVNVEVDHRTSSSWGAGELFPYAGHGVPLRKRHLLSDSAVVFCTLNCDLTSWVATSGCVFAERRREFIKPTRGGRLECMEVEGFGARGLF